MLQGRERQSVGPVECAGRNAAWALEQGSPFPWEAGRGGGTGTLAAFCPPGWPGCDQDRSGGPFPEGRESDIEGGIPSGARGPAACGRRDVSAVGRRCEPGPHVLKIWEGCEKGVWRSAETKTFNHHFIISINLILFPSVPSSRRLCPTLQPWPQRLTLDSGGMGKAPFIVTDRVGTGASERGQAAQPGPLPVCPQELQHSWGPGQHCPES